MRAFNPATRKADGPMSTPRRPWPRSSGTPTIFILRIMSLSLRINAIQHPRKRDRLPQMLQAADPRDDALDTHAEAGMRHAAVLAQIQVPLERFSGKFVFGDTAHQQVEIVNALASADDLAVTFRRDHIRAQRQVGTLWV